MATTVIVFGFGFGVTGLRPALLADEGMWLFNDLPTDHLQTKHGFTPTPAWAEHLMKASVRFNSGGSASFISSTGLVLTNHHVGADTLYKISTPERNYNHDGFCAPTYADEIKAPDLELNQLMSIEDVTSRVQAAVTATMPGDIPSRTLRISACSRCGPPLAGCQSGASGKGGSDKGCP